jgi:hypothetical protein
LPTRSSAIIGVVVALAVCLVGPALVVGSVAGPAGSPVVAGPAPYWIGLVTGDQVAIDSTGSFVTVRPAAGREGVRMTVQRSGGHLYVVPVDAAALVARGAVDRRLFDVTLLARPEYRRQNENGLAVIVTYNGRGPKAVRTAEGVRVEHTYTSVNGEALTLGQPGSADAWQRLTTATGLKRVWLNAVPDSL